MLDWNIIVVVIAIVVSGLGDGIKQSIANRTENWISNFPKKSIDDLPQPNRFSWVGPVIEVLLVMLVAFTSTISAFSYFMTFDLSDAMSSSVGFGTIAALTFANSRRALRARQYLRIGLILGKLSYFEAESEDAKKYQEQIEIIQRERFLNSDEVRRLEVAMNIVDTTKRLKEKLENDSQAYRHYLQIKEKEKISS